MTAHASAWTSRSPDISSPTRITSSGTPNDECTSCARRDTAPAMHDHNLGLMVYGRSDILPNTVLSVMCCTCRVKKGSNTWLCSLLICHVAPHCNSTCKGDYVLILSTNNPSITEYEGSFIMLQNNLPIDPILTYIKALHILVFYLFNINFNIIFTWTLKFPKCSLLIQVFYRHFVCISRLP